MILIFHMCSLKMKLKMVYSNQWVGSFKEQNSLQNIKNALQALASMF